MLLKKSNITLIGNLFVANRVRKSGGALYVQDTFLSLDDTTAGNSFTDNSARFDGGAIFCTYCTIKVRDNNTFRADTVGISSRTTSFSWNRAVEGNGGAMYIYGTASLDGLSMEFSYNQANRGGAICTQHYGHVFLNGTNTTFINNNASLGGAIFTFFDSDVFLNGQSIHFKRNTATIGGAIYVSISRLFITGTHVQFIDNVAKLNGGAIAIDTPFSVDDESIVSGYFSNNSAGTTCGSAIHAYEEEPIIYYIKHVILNHITVVNHYSGSAICLSNVDVSVFGPTIIANNTGMFGGGMNLNSSVISLVGETLFYNNSAVKGGGLLSTQSTITFSGETLFTHNNAEMDGGALLFSRDSHGFEQLN